MSRVSIAKYWCVCLSLLFVACGPSSTEKATGVLDCAKQRFELKQYNAAKLCLDSLERTYPDEIEIITDGRRLMILVETSEQQSSLSFYDSLLVKATAELVLLSKNFVLNPSPLDGHPGEYIHKRQQITNSYNRIFLKTHVQDNGVFYLSSRYHGKSNINHSAVKVYNDGDAITSLQVPVGKLNNRQFDDGFEKWEIVRYYDDKENGIVNFIASNVDKPLKMVFLGKKYHYIVLEKFDKEAVAEGVLLSEKLKQIVALKKSKALIVKRIKHLRQVAKQGK